MKKALSLEIKLSEGPKDKESLSFSRVNEDIAGTGAGEKGTLIFLLTVNGDSKEDLPAKAKDLADFFERVYLQASHGTVLASLEEALTKLSQEVAKEALTENYLSLHIYLL